MGILAQVCPDLVFKVGAGVHAKGGKMHGALMAHLLANNG